MYIKSRAKLANRKKAACKTGVHSKTQRVTMHAAAYNDVHLNVSLSILSLFPANNHTSNKIYETHKKFETSGLSYVK